MAVHGPAPLTRLKILVSAVQSRSCRGPQDGQRSLRRRRVGDRPLSTRNVNVEKLFTHRWKLEQAKEAYKFSEHPDYGQRRHPSLRARVANAAYGAPAWLQHARLGPMSWEAGPAVRE